MATKAERERADWLSRAKKERGERVAARLKEIKKSKRKGSRGHGFTRRDLEALRDGRT